MISVKSSAAKVLSIVRSLKNCSLLFCLYARVPAGLQVLKTKPFRKNGRVHQSKISFIALNVLSLIMLPSAYCQKNYADSNSYVSIITCGKSDQLYAAFGHNAIRVKDPARNIDVCFNYGTFNFAEPGFYKNFMNGRLMYFLSVSTFEDFKNEYQAEGRSLSEQVLCLKDVEKEKIYNHLLNVYSSALRYYRYDFVKNNCSTKIAELLENILGKDRFLLQTTKNKHNTIRENVNRYLTSNDLALVGINLMFGYHADTVCADRVSIFLPDTLQWALDSSKLGGQPIVQKKRSILKEGEHLNKTLKPVLRPVLYSLLITNIILMFLFLHIERARPLRTFFIAQQYVLFTILTLTGVFLLYMWTFSEHMIVRYNLNVLWCNPLLLFCLKRSFSRKCAQAVLAGIFIFSCIYFNSSYLHIIAPLLGTISLLLIYNLTTARDLK